MKLNATVTSQLLAGNARLATQRYMIFPIQVKYSSTKTIKSIYLYYKRCWK
jgi:hypothetical protein